MKEHRPQKEFTSVSMAKLVQTVVVDHSGIETQKQDIDDPDCIVCGAKVNNGDCVLKISAFALSNNLLCIKI